MIEEIKEICERIHLGLGHYHLESVYQNAMRNAFYKAEFKFKTEFNVDVIFDGAVVGSKRLDFHVSGRGSGKPVVVELKAIKKIGDKERNQCRAYMEIIGDCHCVLVNFGSEELEFETVKKFG